MDNSSVTRFTYLAEAYERFTKRINVFQLKNIHILVFGVFLLGGWLLYRNWFYYVFDSPGRFLSTFILGWGCAFLFLYITTRRRK